MSRPEESMTLVERAIVLYRPETVGLLEKIEQFAEARGIEIEAVPVDQFLADPDRFLLDVRHVVTVAEDVDVTQVFALAYARELSVGLVPVNAGSVLCGLYKTPRKLDDTLRLAFEAPEQAIDILLCNGEVVMGLLMLGETPFLDRRSKTYLAEVPNVLTRAWRNLVLLLASLRNLFSFRHMPLTLTTGKEVQIKTAVTGVVVIENDLDTFAASLVNKSISVQDGKVSVLLIAPKSIGEYLMFLLISLFRGSRPLSRLPGAVSYIKTSALKIQGNQALTYYVDGKRREADELTIQVRPKAIRVGLSEEFHALQEAREEGKDTMKVENLPTNADRLAMISRRLPFFSHALEDDFKDLFRLLKENAVIKADYIALMVLSAIVASFGMFLDSAAVIIGAMVLAPLMSPIISLSMGVLRMEKGLLQSSLVTIFVGVAIALATAALIAMMVPIEKLTGEIAARLQPSLLDLGVAIASGIAGGYAHARERVMKSLPGVAIAVALVPPLVVAGIGIGWLEWYVVKGALLLFLTNLIGIALAAALTFLVLGFAPIKQPARSARGLGLSLALMVVVAIPLYWSFDRISKHWAAEHRLASERFNINGKEMWLQDVRVSLLRGEVYLSANIVAADIVERADLAALKALLEDAWQQPVRLEVGYRLSM